MSITVDEAEARLRLALAAKADTVTDADSSDVAEQSFDADVIRLPATPGPARPDRRRWVVVAAAAAVALVIGSAVAITLHGRSTGSAPATPNPHEIPWSQVGPGWALVVTAPTNAEAASSVHTLTLASPAGVHYPIAHRIGDLDIYQDSWNHQNEKVLASTPAGLILIDLHTGSQTTLPTKGVSSGGAVAIGANYLVKQANRLSIIDNTGRVLRQFEGTVSGGFLVSDDGTQVAAGTSTGLVRYDANTGKVVQRWSDLPGTNNCAPQTWVSDSAVIDGMCQQKQSPSTFVGAYFSLATGATTGRTLAGGWHTVRITAGTVAYRDPASPAGTDSLSLGNSEQFARVESNGTLTPLTRPTQFDQGDWQIYYVLGPGFLTYSNGPDAKLVLWNPLSGELTTYFSGIASGDALLAFDVWY